MFAVDLHANPAKNTKLLFGKNEEKEEKERKKEKKKVRLLVRHLLEDLVTFLTRIKIIYMLF